MIEYVYLESTKHLMSINSQKKRVYIFISLISRISMGAQVCCEDRCQCMTAMLKPGESSTLPRHADDWRGAFFGPNCDAPKSMYPQSFIISHCGNRLPISAASQVQRPGQITNNKANYTKVVSSLTEQSTWG